MNAFYFFGFIAIGFATFIAALTFLGDYIRNRREAKERGEKPVTYR